MDQELSHQSSFSPLESWSFFPETSSSSLVLDLMSTEGPEQWFSSNIEEAKTEYVTPQLHTPTPKESTLCAADSEPSKFHPTMMADAAEVEGPVKRRGRKPGLRPTRQASCHVEIERQRREKMNRRFCELRAAVPNVSRMDKSSLLGDAADYITKLRARVEQLEAELRKVAMVKLGASAAGPKPDEAVEVRVVGTDIAVLRVRSPAKHAPASLMAALRSLDLQVRHASVSRVHGMTTQDAVVDVPPSSGIALLGDNGLRTAILQKMQDSTPH
ncbi:Transcription factor MYC3 [Dichanthelium oligosanthes]|uniref:Transcription factor n=1 Tax=Dichanthelium oligosanthes TaxID=888268 RepID=A0A1E5VKA7_9POAL|nr:Transcription factor MYC3 [Dichanthelium oligosanthes]